MVGLHSTVWYVNHFERLRGRSVPQKFGVIHSDLHLTTNTRSRATCQSLALTSCLFGNSRIRASISILQGVMCLINLLPTSTFLLQKRDAMLNRRTSNASFLSIQSTVPHTVCTKVMSILRSLHQERESRRNQTSHGRILLPLGFDSRATCTPLLRGDVLHDTCNMLSTAPPGGFICT